MIEIVPVEVMEVIWALFKVAGFLALTLLGLYCLFLVLYMITHIVSTAYLDAKFRVSKSYRRVEHGKEEQP